MKCSVTNKEITVQVAVNNNSNFGDSTCVTENGLTPPDEKMAKINQISKFNIRDAMVSSWINFIYDKFGAKAYIVKTARTRE